MSKKNFRFSEYLESDEFLEQLDLNLLSPEELIEEAENGSTAAMDRLAMRYLKGSDDFHDFDVDIEKSIYWFKKLAETGSSNAMFNLGMLYYKGYGVKRDFKAAAEWMKKADEAGDDDACMFIADFQKVADAIEKADAGDSEAQVLIAKTLMKYASIFNLGSDLEMFGVKPEPIGQEEDYKECIRYATLAAEQNNGEAFWVLSLAYMHGRGVEKDMDKCIECVEKGVEAGNAMCMNSLGCLYWSGDPIEHEKDNAKALDLFLRAAEQGNGYAMKNLGKFYQYGYGCNGNGKKMLEWYEKAAEVLNDPELDQRVEVFRQLAEIDPDFDKDYPPKHSNTGESFVDTNYDFDAVSEEDEDEDEGVDLSNAINLTKYLPDLVKALRESLGDEAKDLTDKDLEKIIGKLDGETFFSLILMLPKEKKNKILEASGIPRYLYEDEDDSGSGSSTNHSNYKKELIDLLREVMGNDAKGKSDYDLEKILDDLSDETLLSLILLLPDETKKNIPKDSGIVYFKLNNEEKKPEKQPSKKPADKKQTKENNKKEDGSPKVKTKAEKVRSIKTLVSTHKWKKALESVDEMLASDPNCAEALWYKFLIKNKVASKDDIHSLTNNFKEGDYLTIENIFKSATKTFTKELLAVLLTSYEKADDAPFKKLLETILPFVVNDRQKQIEKTLDGVIIESKFESFKFLLSETDSDDEKTLAYILKYAETTKTPSEKSQCFEMILQRDKWDASVLRSLVEADLESLKPENEVISNFELLLKHSSDAKTEVSELLKWLGKNLSNESQCEFAKKLLSYCPDNVSDLEKELVNLSNRMISVGLFDNAEYFLNLILSFDKNSFDAHWGLMMTELKAKTDDEIVNGNASLGNSEEFKTCLRIAEGKNRKKCTELYKKEARNKVKALKDSIDTQSKELETIQNIAEIENESKKLKGLLIGTAVAAVITLISLCFMSDEILWLIVTGFAAYVLLSEICGIKTRGWAPLSDYTIGPSDDGCIGCLFGIGSFFCGFFFYTFLYPAFGWGFAIMEISSNSKSMKEKLKNNNFDTSSSIAVLIFEKNQKINQLKKESTELEDMISANETDCDKFLEYILKHEETSTPKSNFEDSEENGGLQGEKVESDSKGDKNKKSVKKIIIIAAVIISVALAAFIVTKTVIIPTSMYNKAIALLNSGEKDEAYSLFEQLGTFKDSEDQKNEIDYSKAQDYLDTKLYNKAYYFFNKVKGYKDSGEKMQRLEKDIPNLPLCTAEKGSIVVLGEYEQDDNTFNGKEPIEWIVLHNQEGAVYLLSKKVLDAQQFNSANREGCVLDDWLKTTFFDNAFKHVSEGTITRVGLLNEKEIEQYNISQETLAAELTSYALSKHPEHDSTCGYFWWSTQDELNDGYSDMLAPVVWENGLYDARYLSITSYCGVRPTLWIFADSENLPKEPDYYSNN